VRESRAAGGVSFEVADQAEDAEYLLRKVGTHNPTSQQSTYECRRPMPMSACALRT
jgi:hypothetical protein